MLDINQELTKLTAKNTLAKKVLFNEDLPYSSVRRKLEIKRRENVYRNLLTRKKQSKRIRAKNRLRNQVKINTRKWRASGASFRERIEYYDSLEHSYWYYLKKKYGIKNILSLEEFEEHITPWHKPGVNFIVRRDKSRKDWFLDNIMVSYERVCVQTEAAGKDLPSIVG